MKLHLPISLLTAVISALTVTSRAADSISVNFEAYGGKVTENATGTLGGVEASDWNNVVAENTNATLKNQDGVDAATIVLSNINNSWASNIATGDTLISQIQHGYIDVPNSWEQHYNILVDTDYWLVDATFYMSADSPDNQYGSINVNGVSYKGGTDVIGPGAWGATGNPAGVTEYNDTNSITATGLTGYLNITNDYIAGNARTTLAGMQIFDSAEQSGCFTELSDGETLASGASWTRNGASVNYADIANGKKYLGISANANGSTIKFSNGETIDSLASVANTVTITSDGAITIKDLYAYDNTSIVLNTEATVNTMRVSGEALSIGEDGILKTGIENVRNIIETVTGTGRIEAGGELIINGNETNNGGSAKNIAFAGTIAMASDAKIYLGSNASGGYTHTGWAVDMSSATIEVNGGGLQFNGGNSSLKKLVVNSGENTLYMYDCFAEEQGLSIDTVELNSDLVITNLWKGKLDIDLLTGTGDLKVNADRSNQDFKVNIGSIVSSGLITNNYHLNLGADASSVINLQGTITNTGALTVNGAISISDNLALFTLLEEGSDGGLSAGSDGYQITTGSTYLLVDNDGNGTVSITPTSALYKGNTIDLTYNNETGDVTFVGDEGMDTIYRVNTTDVTVGGASATENSERATSFIVAENRTVTIAGDSDNASAKELLLHTTGAGNVTLATNVTLANNEKTQATGKLTVDGVRLTLGTGDSQTAGISSFSSVELNNAYIYFQNSEDTFNNVTVTANGATLELEDMGNADEGKALHLAGTTALNGNLNVLSHWNSQLKFDLLTGAGNVVIDDDSRSEPLIVTINGGNNYTGKVHVKQTSNNLSMNVAENAGVHVHYEGTLAGGQLNLTNIAAGNTVTLQGAVGYLTQNSTINADVTISNYSASDGAKAGLEINDGFSNSTNTFAGDITGSGNLVLNKTGLDNFKQVFSGDVSGWTGKMDVAAGTHYVEYTGDSTVINNQDIGVRGGTATVTFNHTAATTVNSKLLDKATFHVVLSNTSQEGITFTSNEIAMDSLTVNAGTRAAFTGISNLTVTDLNLGASSVLTIGNGVAVADSGASAAMKATGAVTLAGGATVVGGLNLSEATGLTLNGLGSAPVTITGDLILGGEPISLSGDVLSALTGLSAGQTLNLFDVSGILSINGTDYDTIADNSYLLSDVFSADVITDSFYLGYQNNMVYAGLVVPEPATASLSLLGLAALMMRRRRVK